MEMIIEASKDPMIVILLVVAVVRKHALCMRRMQVLASMRTPLHPTPSHLLITAQVTVIIGAAVPEQRAHHGWSEGLAVLGTAAIVVFIAAGQDYSKELQFQKLNALKDAINVKVVRGGKQEVVPNTDVVVGDVMFLDTGDKIIADGVVFKVQGLVIDEASLTGESDPIKKTPEGDAWLRSGTTVRPCLPYVSISHLQCTRLLRNPRHAVPQSHAGQ
jgi:magnesium-transporting ATPase (P-type)